MKKIYIGLLLLCAIAFAGGTGEIQPISSVQKFDSSKTYLELGVSGMRADDRHKTGSHCEGSVMVDDFSGIDKNILGVTSILGYQYADNLAFEAVARLYDYSNTFFGAYLKPSYKNLYGLVGVGRLNAQNIHKTGISVGAGVNIGSFFIQGERQVNGRDSNSFTAGYKIEL